MKVLEYLCSPLKRNQSMKTEIVAEIEGEYGPLTISEHLVQKIWARGEFRQTDIRTLEGKRLEILNLGTWNRLDGPDFKNASFLIEGELVNGDAELHFFDSDWSAHGHESDPAFKKVVLHILVFPPKQKTRRDDCSIEHSLLLIDLLPQGLESYAEEEVLGALSAGEETALEEALFTLSLGDRKARILNAAKKRWTGKVAYARKRIELLGWEEACHQTAMEILGYRYNRSTMLFVAGDYTLNALRTGSHTVESIFEAGKGRWKLSGSRPANHPKHRIAQYLAWVSLRSQWPENLVRWGKAVQKAPEARSEQATRRQLGLAKWKQQLAADVLADTIGGTRIENLVCDGFLPLLAASSDEDLFFLWYHWYPGDVPSVLKQLFQRLGEGSSVLGPGSNGANQGLIGCLLEM